MTLAERPHPFPSRTRKLSSPAPKILRGQPFGKIGRRQGFCVFRFQLSAGDGALPATATRPGPAVDVARSGHEIGSIVAGILSSWSRQRARTRPPAPARPPAPMAGMRRPSVRTAHSRPSPRSARSSHRRIEAGEPRHPPANTVVGRWCRWPRFDPRSSGSCVSWPPTASASSTRPPRDPSGRPAAVLRP